jgi:hypothetical protein
VGLGASAAPPALPNQAKSPQAACRTSNPQVACACACLLACLRLSVGASAGLLGGGTHMHTRALSGEAERHHASVAGSLRRGSIPRIPPGRHRRQRSRARCTRRSLLWLVISSADKAGEISARRACVCTDQAFNSYKCSSCSLINAPASRGQSDLGVAQGQPDSSRR